MCHRGRVCLLRKNSDKMETSLELIQPLLNLLRIEIIIMGHFVGFWFCCCLIFLGNWQNKEREREKIRIGSGINDITDDLFNKLLISVLVAIPIQILLVVECESLLLTASLSPSFYSKLFWFYLLTPFRIRSRELWYAI